jgi:hypothetical protein
MKTYIVGMTIHDAFHFRADTPDDVRKALQELQDMHPLELLDDGALKVTYTMKEDVA